MLTVKSTKMIKVKNTKLIKVKNFKMLNLLRGWLLVLGLKEGLVKFATVCIKSEVILLLGLFICDVKFRYCGE